MRRSVAFLIVGLVLLALASPVASADLMPAPARGWHAIEHEAFVDLGTFGDCLTWHYRMRDGDTLGEVAQRELGSALRHKEILALNPGLKPRRVTPGTMVEMPPRGNGCERGQDRYVFFAWAPASAEWSAPRRLANDRIHQIGHGTCLFAVPVERLTGVCAASGPHPLCAKALAKDPKVARSGVLDLQAAVPDEDPTERMVSHYKVVGIQGGRIHLKSTGRARYDAEGRRLETSGDDGAGGATALQVLVFLLMLSGIGFAVAHAQRKAAGTPDEAADAAAEPGSDGEDEHEYESEYESEDDAEDEE